MGGEGGCEILETLPKGRSIPDLGQLSRSDRGGVHLGTIHSPSENQDMPAASNSPPNTFQEKAAPPAETSKLQSLEGASMTEG